MTQNTNGRDELHLWFGLSYASFLTLPRTFMQAMPDEWQGRMAELLNEWDDHWDFTKLPSYQFIVQAKLHNQFTKMPTILTDYRHYPSQDINRAYANQAACKEPNP